MAVVEISRLGPGPDSLAIPRDVCTASMPWSSSLADAITMDFI